MLPILSRAAAGLSVALWCGVALGAPRTIKVTVDIKVPLTDVWRNLGVLEPLRAEVVRRYIEEPTATSSSLRGTFSRFGFVRWVDAGRADAELRLTIHEDSRSTAGTKPWSLSMKWMGTPGAGRWDDRKLVEGDVAHAIPRTAEESKNRFLEWIDGARNDFTNPEVANRFIHEMLQWVIVATQVEPLNAESNNVEVNVPCVELNAGDNTDLNPHFTTSSGNHDFIVKPVGAPADGRNATYTDCQFLDYNDQQMFMPKVREQKQGTRVTVGKYTRGTPDIVRCGDTAVKRSR